MPTQTAAESPLWLLDAANRGTTTNRPPTSIANQRAARRACEKTAHNSRRETVPTFDPDPAPTRTDVPNSPPADPRSSYPPARRPDPAPPQTGPPPLAKLLANT